MDKKTILIDGLTPFPGGEGFSARMSYNDMYSTLVELPSKPIMAAIAYDAFFDERHINRGKVLNKTHPVHIDPALRARDAFTGDYFVTQAEWFSRTGNASGTSLYDGTKSYNDTIKMAELHAHKNGTVAYSNGRHRTRCLYEFGATKLPFIMNGNLEALNARVEKIGYRMEKGKTLFPFAQIAQDFLSLPKAASKAEFNENLFMFKKFVTAKKPEDLFLKKKDFKALK